MVLGWSWFFVFQAVYLKVFTLSQPIYCNVLFSLKEYLVGEHFSNAGWWVGYLWRQNHRRRCLGNCYVYGRLLHLGEESTFGFSILSMVVRLSANTDGYEFISHIVVSSSYICCTGWQSEANGSNDNQAGSQRRLESFLERSQGFFIFVSGTISDFSHVRICVCSNAIWVTLQFQCFGHFRPPIYRRGWTF